MYYNHHPHLPKFANSHHLCAKVWGSQLCATLLSRISTPVLGDGLVEIFVASMRMQCLLDRVPAFWDTLSPAHNNTKSGFRIIRSLRILLLLLFHKYNSAYIKYILRERNQFAEPKCLFPQAHNGTITNINRKKRKWISILIYPLCVC